MSYPNFRYADADGFDLSVTARADALERARALLTEDGGVLYDDSRAYIVADGGDTGEVVRVAGDEITHEQAHGILHRLTEGGYAWDVPLTRDALLRAAGIDP